MNFLVNLVEKENTELDKKTIEYVIKYLNKEGYISYTVQYYYDIFEFYSKSVDHYKGLGLQKKCAMIDTCEHFKISEPHLYRIIRIYQNSDSLND
jgi:hypothetical protein